METPEFTTLTVKTTVNAPIAKVWDCFTKPDHITHWSFASDDWHSPYAENDLRVGGSFKTGMAAKDGSMAFDFGGIYSAVENHRLIAYSLADGRKVKITFTANGDTTEVVEDFDAEKTHPFEQQQGGWQAIMDNFKKYVEGM